MPKVVFLERSESLFMAPPGYRPVGDPRFQFCASNLAPPAWRGASTGWMPSWRSTDRRSAFAARFAERVGKPPLDYLTRWRMELARRMLREGRRDVAQVAAEVGYSSQSAFGHAFKHTFGHSPRRPV